MKRRLNTVLTLPLICGTIITCVCLSSARSQKDVPASTGLPLIPFFSPEQDSPKFMGTFHTGNQRADILKLIEASTIIIDGKTYPFLGEPAFEGVSSGIAAHAAIAFDIDVNSYVGSHREYDTVNKQNYWKSSLSSGRHTLTARFGGKAYGPVTFIWQADPNANVDLYKVYAP